MKVGQKEQSFEILRLEESQRQRESSLKNHEKKVIKLEGNNIPQKLSNFHVNTSHKPSTQAQTTREENNSQSSGLLSAKPSQKYQLKVDIPNNSFEILAKTWSQFSPKTGKSDLAFKKGDVVKLESNSKCKSSKRI